MTEDTQRRRAFTEDRTLGQATVPPSRPIGEDVEDATGSGSFAVARDVVALIVDEPSLRTAVGRMLSSVGVATAGPDAMSDALTIVASVHPTTNDVGERLGQLRALARPDAAIVLLIEDARNDDVVAAHRAGAVAGLRVPLVEDELLAVVRRCVADHTLRDQVADLSRQLDHHTHLASLGRVAAGLSHELGNPLAVARLTFEEIRSLLDPASANAPAVAELGASLRRMGEILRVVGDLVAPAARRQLTPIALAPVVRRVLGWNQLDDIDVEVNEETEVVALGDETLIEQILTNLTANAAVAARRLVSPRIRYHLYYTGQLATVSVRDNGIGIPPDVQERIFEPFYTSRRGEGGTGLGLALCREYASRMGGSLGLWSAPGRGACFRLYLHRP